MSRRIEWIDNLRGFGILMVMLGHALTGGALKGLIYSFHLPVFFFASGYLFNPLKYKSSLSFVKSRSRTLLVPYFVFSIVIILFRAFVILGKNLLVNSITSYNEVYNSLIGVVVQMRNTDYSGFCWFLALLFISQILLYYLVKISKSNYKYIILSLILLFVIGWAYIYFIGISLPWHIDASFVSVFFVGLGFIVRNKAEIFSKITSIKLLPVYILINLICTYANYRLTGKIIDLYESSLGNPIFYILAGCSGTMACIIIVMRIPKNRLLEYMGKNSLTYYALHHKIFFYVLNPVILYVLGKTIGDNIFMYSLRPVLLLILTIILISPICYLINKYLPFIAGRRHNKQKAV